MIFNIYRQDLPQKDQASLVQVGSVEATNADEAIKAGKKLCRNPIVHHPYMDMMVREERERASKAFQKRRD